MEHGKNHLAALAPLALTALLTVAVLPVTAAASEDDGAAETAGPGHDGQAMHAGHGGMDKMHGGGMAKCKHGMGKMAGGKHGAHGDHGAGKEGHGGHGGHGSSKEGHGGHGAKHGGMGRMAEGGHGGHGGGKKGHGGDGGKGHGMHGRMAAMHRDLTGRMDLLEARMIKMEAMLERLLMR